MRFKKQAAAASDAAYQEALLRGWEAVFKKGQLTLWILLALKDAPKHMAEIKQFIESATQHVVTADDQSMYRALRRYAESEIVDFTSQSGEAGPDKKVYQLTPLGRRVLQVFIQRNFINVFYRKDIQRLLEKE